MTELIHQVSNMKSEVRTNLLVLVEILIETESKRDEGNQVRSLMTSPICCANPGIKSHTSKKKSCSAAEKISRYNGNWLKLYSA